MQNDFYFWLNASAIILAGALLTVRLFLPRTKDEPLTGERAEERDSLLALLQETIQSLRTPEAARLLSAALLKKEVDPFVRFIEDLRSELHVFALNLIGQDEFGKFEQGLPFQLKGVSQHEPFNIALSVRDSTLEELIHVHDGELQTFVSVHLYSLLRTWGTLRQRYHAIKESTGGEHPVGGGFSLPPATERIIELTSRVNVFSDSVKESSLKLLAEIEEKLKDTRVPPEFRSRLADLIRGFRTDLARAPRINSVEHHQISEHPRLEEEAEAAFVGTGLLASRIVEVCASWVLVEATFEIERKHEALRTGKTAFSAK